MNPVEKFWRWALQPFLAPRELRKLRTDYQNLQFYHHRALEDLERMRDAEMKRLYDSVRPILNHYEANISLVETRAAPQLRIKLTPLGYNYVMWRRETPKMNPEVYRHALRDIAHELGLALAQSWFDAGVVERLEPSPEHDHNRKALRIRHRN